MIVITLLAVVVAYFGPIIIAVARGHDRLLAIVLLDLFAGWTMIGWLAALIWSVAGQAEKPNGSAALPITIVILAALYAPISLFMIGLL